MSESQGAQLLMIQRRESAFQVCEAESARTQVPHRRARARKNEDGQVLFPGVHILQPCLEPVPGFGVDPVRVLDDQDPGRLAVAVS